jgi:protein-L-isoaspartate(D-aspartate) O-methyltransferase
MVDRIVADGWTRSDRVATAMRAVPRHRFVPSASVEEAYADQAVITKRGGDGAALSCASVPGIVAMMLDQLDVQLGHRILEIGAGTGYNAALLAYLTGPDGQVTTVDVDPDIVGQARRALDTAGFAHVNVVLGDGAVGHGERAPYDRIVVTVGAWDLPPAWSEQLVPEGRLVVPLRWRGQTRSVGFVREGSRLRSDAVELCGFVPMVGQDGERMAAIDTEGHVTLYWDVDQQVDPDALLGVLDQPRSVAWSGVTVVSDEPFDGIWLRLTATEPATCRFSAAPYAVDTGLCAPAIPTRSPALVDGGSLAYLTFRRRDEGDAVRFELGGIGHGPLGGALADRMCEETRSWSRNRTVRPVITAYTTHGSDEGTPVPHTICKRDSTLTIVY